MKILTQNILNKKISQIQEEFAELFKGTVWRSGGFGSRCLNINIVPQEKKD